MVLQVNVIGTLKGDKRYYGGQIFDSDKGKIPSDILGEYNNGTGTVVRLPNYGPQSVSENKTDTDKTDNEIKETETTIQLNGLIEKFGSKAEVARQLDISTQTLDKWLKGGNVKQEKQELIGKLLNDDGSQSVSDDNGDIDETDNETKEPETAIQ